MLTVEVPETVAKRVRQMAKEANRTPDEYIRVVLKAGLEDIEEVHAAFQSLQRVQNGEEKTYTRKEMKDEFGLGD